MLVFEAKFPNKLKLNLFGNLQEAIKGLIGNHQSSKLCQAFTYGVVKCKTFCYIRWNPCWVKFIHRHQLSGSSNVTSLSDPGGNKTTMAKNYWKLKEASLRGKCLDEIICKLRFPRSLDNRAFIETTLYSASLQQCGAWNLP